MDDSCAVCAETLEWVAYGSCGHREVCSTCVVRLRVVLEDRRCCICKTESPTVFVTKAMGDYTRVITDFSAFPDDATEGKNGSFWYHEGSQAYFDDVDHYRMIKAMCRLSCSICDKNAEENGSENTKRRNRFRHIDQLKGHLFHQHKLHMCNLCLEGRKVFICEQKLYTKSQLLQHKRSGDSEVDGSESERGGFMGHPNCEFCRTPFYGENELYMHMSREHYTCHICQRQHPGQYDYFKNYDDLETHFRQEHFLCEDEGCLEKKFVVFQSETEMKRHNTIEHGGHMSRSKRNSALQIPTSFRYRRNDDHDQRRGRGRGFRPDPSNNQLSMAIQASLETAAADGRADRVMDPRESTVYSSSDPPPSSVASNSQSSLEASYFPPLSDREPPEPSSRYALALGNGSATRLREELFPPLPGAKKKSKPKQAVDGTGSSSTLASRLNRGKGAVKVFNPPQPTSSEPQGPSISANFPQLRPIQNQGSLTSASSSSSKPQPALNQVAKASVLVRENGFASLISNNPGWNLTIGSRMRHSSSAPNLVDAPKQPLVNPTSTAGKQSVSYGEQSFPAVEDVHTANKSLVERIRIGLGNDEERYAAFKSISAEYRQGQINTWEYISYVEQFGLMHLVLELARLCPDPRKRKELIDAYNANIQNRALQENGGPVSGTSMSSKHRKKGKGKAVVAEEASRKDELADSFLNTVRKLQLNQTHQAEEPEVLSKDGYRTAKSTTNSSSASVLMNSSSSGQNLNGGSSSSIGENNKQSRKTSKFVRNRLGDVPAARLDVARANSSTETAVEEASKKSSKGRGQGVWGNNNNAGRQLFQN